jgi:hypothetical protein
MATDERSLREAIAKLSPSKNARRYPETLRAEITAYARRRLAEGTSFAAVCLELDIGEPTLHGFLGSSRPSEKRRPGFARVRVRAVAALPTSEVPRIVRGPCGLVLEGFSTEEIADLVRRLSCSA